MTLLLSTFAAIISTVIWYRNGNESRMMTGTLSLILWGASLMWFADAVIIYLRIGQSYFTPEPYAMLNDTFLGLCAIALALVIWLVILLIKDPKGVLKETLFKKK